MEHPFTKLQPEYTYLLGIMHVRPECREEIDRAAERILSNRHYFQEVQDAISVPIVFSGPSFLREADLDFNLSPAQGDSWRRVSVHVPKGLGPYPNWLAAAVAAYTSEGLDKVGEWTWELVCYYAELFNGFGYRDYHHMHSPYVWGGTNIQTVGKYDADGQFNPSHMDPQVGVIAVAKRMVDIAPDLAIGGPVTIVPPIPSSLADHPTHDVKWLQVALERLGYEIAVDGSYGRQTRAVVAAFEHAYGLREDGGYAGPEVYGAIEKALAALSA